MNHTVTIAVPIYGVEEYIERCAKSLFEQTYRNIEFLFIDDCSKDRSIDILINISKQYPFLQNSIRIIKHDVNKGLAAARNTAVENAKGDFIIHVDSDDYIEKDTVELMMLEQTRTNADIVFSDAIYEYKTHHENICLTDTNKPKEELVKELIKYGSFHNIWGKLIRISLYKKHNIRTIENINIGEDWQVLPLLVYYSSIITKVSLFLYHYDYSRTNSYMHFDNSDESSKKYLTSIVFTLHYLSEQFTDKGANYMDVIWKNIAPLAFDAMILCCKCHDKNLFLKMRNIYSNIPRSYLTKTGRTDIISRFIKSNYYLLRLLLKYKGIALS